jgi:hypothetical protein
MVSFAETAGLGLLDLSSWAFTVKMEARIKRFKSNAIFFIWFFLNDLNSHKTTPLNNDNS